MASELEQMAVTLVEVILRDGDFPSERLKLLKIDWSYISGEYFPNLECQFYEEED